MKWMQLALLGAVTSCSSAATQSRVEGSSFASPHSSLATYHAFRFGLADQPKPGYEVTPRSLEVQRRLRPAVLEALKARGYREDELNADFVVKLTAGTGTVPDQSNTRDVGLPFVNTDRKDLARGFIGIDVYDGPTGTQVWQGSAFAEIDPASIDDSLLKLGVSHMLADFPAREVSKVAVTP